MLNRCGYPRSFILKCINSFVLDKNSVNTNIHNNKPNNFIQIPYTGLPSLTLAKKLKKLFSEAKLDISVIFSPTKIKSYFSLKDKTPLLLKSGVVYKYSCQVDPDCFYIGRTSRHLFRRIKEHEKSGSQIFHHTSSCNQCQSNITNRFEILATSSCETHLNILEALHIRNSNPSINKQLHKSGMSFVLNIFT